MITLLLPVQMRVKRANSRQGCLFVLSKVAPPLTRCTHHASHAVFRVLYQHHIGSDLRVPRRQQTQGLLQRCHRSLNVEMVVVIGATDGYLRPQTFTLSFFSSPSSFSPPSSSLISPPHHHHGLSKYVAVVSCSCHFVPLLLPVCTFIVAIMEKTF